MLKNEKGMTLVEMMMAVGASTMIAYAIFASLRVTATTFETSNVKMTVQTSAREGLYRMVQEIRESSPTRVAVAADGNSITFTVPNSSSPVTGAYATNWGNQIQYSLGTGSNAGRIIRTNLTTGAVTTMASDVTDVTFAGNSGTPTVVTVTLSVQRALTNGRNVPATPLQITGQARLRNS